MTGATGFLGGSIARKLARDGVEVVAAGRNERLLGQLESEGLPTLRLDLATERLAPHCDGVDVVVHCAALSAPWGPAADFRAANVEATANVLDAVRQGVGRLVHISTPSIYHNGGARFDVGEDAPLAQRFINTYTRTKFDAEELVRKADVDSIILRPRALFGPQDTVLVPRILRALKTGRVRVVGDGENVVSMTYIDDAVNAAILASRAPLVERGRAYNITSGPEVKLWSLIRRLATELDLPQPRGHIARVVARGVAHALEKQHQVLRREGEPVLTRYGVDVVSLSMTLNIDRAREELGFEPLLSQDEAVARTIDYFRSEVR